MRQALGQAQAAIQPGEVQVSEGGSRLRVCHVFAGTEGGRWVIEQLQALRDQHGFEVHAVLGGNDGRTVDHCREAGIPFTAFDFGFGGWKALFTIPWRILKLAAWMRARRFDVVQSHVIQSTLFARPAAWLADIPVRLTMVTGPFYMQAPVTRRMEKATAWMETNIIPSCELTGRLYEEAGAARGKLLPTLYYGPRAEDWDPAGTPRADLRKEFGLAPEAKLVGCVAVFYARCGGGGFIPPETRHRHVKGHDDLIRAMPRVIERVPKARLLLFGKGWGPAGDAAEAELRELVREAGLEDKVIFAGYRQDIASVYLDLDVSVQASLNENLGGTVESLLMARPTVATRVGGMPDSVVDGETGRLVQPSDPESLAEGIAWMLENPVEARRLGEAGRERMLAGFTLATTAAGLGRAYVSERRRAGQRAWRLSASVRRLLVAALLHPPILGRSLVVDLHLAQSAFARIRSLPARARGLAYRALRLVRLTLQRT